MERLASAGVSRSVLLDLKVNINGIDLSWPFVYSLEAHESVQDVINGVKTDFGSVPGEKEALLRDMNLPQTSEVIVLDAKLRAFWEGKSLGLI